MLLSSCGDLIPEDEDDRELVYLNNLMIQRHLANPQDEEGFNKAYRAWLSVAKRKKMKHERARIRNA